MLGVAADVDSGLLDRMRSLPIPRSAVLLGRSLADTALVGWGLFITLAVGVLTGFRIHGSLGEAAAAIGLCLVYGFAFSWPFIYMGLTAGNAQAAQGMSFLAGLLEHRALTLVDLPTGHWPMWSKPVELAAIIDVAARAAAQR